MEEYREMKRFEVNVIMGLLFSIVSKQHPDTPWFYYGCTFTSLVCMLAAAICFFREIGE